MRKGENIVSLKQNKVKCNKTRCACCKRETVFCGSNGTMDISCETEAGPCKPRGQTLPNHYFVTLANLSNGKESACNAKDRGSIPGSGRSPGEKNGYPPQYSCLENFMDRVAWWATVHGVTKSQTQLSDWYFYTLFHSHFPLIHQRLWHFHQKWICLTKGSFKTSYGCHGKNQQ